jgi:hypothetical protein
MKIRQFANLSSIKTLKIVAISSLAVGVATTISAAPASAVVIAPGSQLAFNDGLLNTSGTLAPGTTGSTFQGTFTGNGGTIVSQASGTFSSIFAAVAPTAPSPLGAKFVTSNPVLFQQVGASATIPGGIDYAPTTALSFNFGSAGILTLPTGTRFLYSPATSTGTGVARSNFNIYTTPSFAGTFTNGGDVTPLNFTSFSFDVDNFDNTNLTINPSPNGSFSLVATATAVPEPFTIIGTIVGGTAAFRMRKKLSSSAKNAKN